MERSLGWLGGCGALLRQRRPRTLAGRLLVAAVAIAVALGVEAATGGRWRWLVGGAAVVISLLALIPRLSGLVKPVGAYVGVWLAFNILRALADDTAWAQRVLGLVPRFQAWLFAGTLPSAAAQRRFYEPGAPDAYDYGWTAVYLSFFAAPHLVAVLVLWRDRRLFWRYVLATAVLFALSLVAFFAIPTSPPWLATETVPKGNFAPIRRVTEEVLARLDLPVRLFNDRQTGAVRTTEVRIEPNPIAAMPSIHFAATALLVPLAARASRLLAGAAVLYAGLMGTALVYLGEHYVLDLAVGGILAAVGWAAAGVCLGGARRGAGGIGLRRSPWSARATGAVSRTTQAARRRPRPPYRSRPARPVALTPMGGGDSSRHPPTFTDTYPAAHRLSPAGSRPSGSWCEGG